MNLTSDIFLPTETSSNHHPTDAHALLRPSQDPGDLVPVCVGNLRTYVDLHTSIGGQARNAAFRLDKGVLGDGRMKGMLEHNVCLVKAHRHIPFAYFDMLKQIPFGMQRDGIRLAGPHRICYGRQGLKLEFNQIQCLGGNFAIFGGNEGDRIPNIANPLADSNQNRPVVHHQAMILFTGNIRRGENRDHTRKRASFFDINLR